MREQGCSSSVQSDSRSRIAVIDSGSTGLVSASSVCLQMHRVGSLPRRALLPDCLAPPAISLRYFLAQVRHQPVAGGDHADYGPAGSVSMHSPLEVASV